MTVWVCSHVGMHQMPLLFVHSSSPWRLVMSSWFCCSLLLLSSVPKIVDDRNHGLSVTEFFPVLSRGCWNITSDVINRVYFVFSMAVQIGNRVNPGKCAAYCRRFGGTRTKYGAMVGTTCYCTNTLSDSSSLCDVTCGKGQVWPGYVCGQSAGLIGSVYEDIGNG